MKFDNKLQIPQPNADRSYSEIGWQQLVDTVLKECPDRHWIFRGQDTFPLETGPDGSVEISIESSFDAACKRPQTGAIRKEQRRLYESWMLFEFKREAHRHIDRIPAHKNFLEWMALARQYEMPSRLLDFTYSFFVASYFALSRRAWRQKSQTGKLVNENACVLAINLSELTKHLEKKISTNPEDWGAKSEDSSEAITEVDLHYPEIFHHFAFVKCRLGVVPVVPFIRHDRLGIQQGLFLCPGDISRSFEENLEESLKEMPSGKRIIRLDGRWRSEAIRSLRRMNINIASLYPDLAGWAQSQADLVHVPLETDDNDRHRKLLESHLRFDFKA